MGLSAQIKAFFLTIVLGIMAGMIFHFYLLMIKSMRLGKYYLYLMDLVIWIVMIFIIFAAMLLINQGEIRIYVFIALISGIVSYYKFIARYFKEPLGEVASYTVAFVNKLISIGMKPFIIMLKMIKAICKRRHKSLPEDDLDPEEKIL